MKINFTTVCICLLLFLSGNLMAQKFKVDTLQYQGTIKNMVNIAIVGDGYTQEQQKQFIADARRFTDYLFTQAPYSHYRQYFNVFAVGAISLESGVKHAHNAPEDPIYDKHPFPNVVGNNYPRNAPVPASNPNNYFGSSFDNSGLHRLVVPGNSRLVRSVLNDNVPNYNQAIVLANSPYYGGSGGAFATVTVNAVSNDIAIHELGHSFANLADEYWPGLQFLQENVNRTQYPNLNELTWKKWVGTNSIGVYSYGGSAANSVWYRPSEYCKMQYLIAGFCSVCSEAIIEKIHSLTNPIIKTMPDAAVPIKADSLKLLRVQLAQPDPNTLKTSWYLNDKLITSNIDSVRINPGFLKVGQNILSVRVTDTTDLVRTDGHASHNYETHWTIQNDVQRPLTPPMVRWGDTIQTCYNTPTVLTVKSPEAGYKYSWYKDKTGKKPVATGLNFVTATININTTFYLEATWENQKTARVPVVVKVLPEVAEPQIAMEMHTDTVKLTVVNPDPNFSYRWYDSATGAKPIGGGRGAGAEAQKYRVARNGTTFEAPIAAGNTAYYVEAVLRSNTCYSKRKKVDVKK
jgi:hypothetical protein